MIPSLPPQLHGCKIFPIVPGTKDPATKNGWKDASDNPAQIAEWLQINPDWNWAVACGLSDLFVFDIDPAGLEHWEKLKQREPAIREALADALTVRTPKGGYHFYFKGSGPSTASRIAEGIDTRGGFERDGRIVSGGYVILPGSRTKSGPGRVDGVYELLGGTLKPLPPVMRGIVPERKKTDTLGLEKSPDKDQPRNVQWAIDLLQNYVKTGHVAVEGKGGDNLTFQVVASVLDKAISPGMAYELLQEHWNPHCVPPWDEWELEQKIRNAAEYGEDTGEGVKGFQSNADAFAAFAGMEVETTAPTRNRRGVMLLHEYADNVLDPTWLVPQLIPANGVGMIYGDSGSYKSFLALDMALSLAFGVPGQWNAPPVKNDVLFFAGEGSIATAKKRWPAWMDHNAIEFRNDHRFFIHDNVPFFSNIEEWNFIKGDLAKLQTKPSLIVIDTLARLMTGMDENATKDMQLIINFLEELARYYECTVMVIHHTGKDQSKGARGSSALLAGVDFAMYTKKTQMGTLLKVKKQKDADVSDDVRYFKTKDVGSSIVLELTDEAPGEETPQGQSSRYPWASAQEVAAILTDKLNGASSTAYLVAAIAGEHGLDQSTVRKQLLKSGELAFLRVDANNWKVPGTGMEFDL